MFWFINEETKAHKRVKKLAPGTEAKKLFERRYFISQGQSFQPLQ